MGIDGTHYLLKRYSTGEEQCDRKILDSLKKVKPVNFTEKVDRAVLRAIIGTKYKLGLGAKNNSKVER